MVFLLDVWYIKDDPERSPYGFSWFSQQERVVLRSLYTAYKGNICQQKCQTHVFATKSIQIDPKLISSKSPWLKIRKDLEFRIKNNPELQKLSRNRFCKFTSLLLCLEGDQGGPLLEDPWGSLGGPLQVSWAPWGRSWGHLGASWRSLGSPLGVYSSRCSTQFLFPSKFYKNPYLLFIFFHAKFEILAIFESG